MVVIGFLTGRLKSLFCFLLRDVAFLGLVAEFVVLLSVTRLRRFIWSFLLYDSRLGGGCGCFDAELEALSASVVTRSPTLRPFTTTAAPKKSVTLNALQSDTFVSSPGVPKWLPEAPK